MRHAQLDMACGARCCHQAPPSAVHAATRRLEIITPKDYVGSIMELAQQVRRWWGIGCSQGSTCGLEGLRSGVSMQPASAAGEGPAVPP